MARKKQTRKKSPKKVQKTRKDVSIIQDVKEPFSWYRFWDEKIVQSWQNFKNYLDKKGILYLLMSPFRYRARLLFRLWLIVICVLVGIVPRTLTLIENAKQQYRSNELVLVENKTFISGRFTVVPLLSSHKNNVHVMTFNIYGSSGSGVSSKTDAYDVRLTPRQGVSKPNEMFYRYQIVPFDSNQRILVLELDLSKTENTGGLFDLWVNEKDKQDMEKPLEITISKQQVEGPLYDGTVHLSALSNLLSPSSNTNAIKQAESKLDSLLNTYKLEYERLGEMGTKVRVTPEQMNEYAKSKLLFNGVKDDSTTDVVTDPPIKVLEPVLPVSNAITIGNRTITDVEYNSSNSETLAGLDSRLTSDMVGVIEADANIANSINAVNQARLAKYAQLYALARTLSQPLKQSSYTSFVTVADTVNPKPTSE